MNNTKQDWLNLNCKTCDGGLDLFEEQFEQCFDDILADIDGVITRDELFRQKLDFYKARLVTAIKDASFNGAGMRQLISEFSDLVNWNGFHYSQELEASTLH